jgi:hypothetical protein
MPAITLNERNTIVLVGDLWEKPEESRAGATITPGMLLGQTTTALTQPGERPRVVPHATAGGPCEKKFAKENAWKGGTLSADGEEISGGTIDDDYATGDTVLIHHAQPGDVIYALVPASAAAIVLSDYLTSNGDGTLKKAATTDTRIAVPLEAVDNSTNGTTTARIRVRIL